MKNFLWAYPLIVISVQQHARMLLRLAEPSRDSRVNRGLIKPNKPVRQAN